MTRRAGPQLREHRPATFTPLPADVAEHCRCVGQRIAARRGRILTRQGAAADRCYLVRAGYARVLSTSAAGHPVLLGFMGPGDVIGQAAATASAGCYLASTVAAQPMDLVSWSRDDALRLARLHPQVHARLEALLIRNSAVLIKRLHTVSEGSAARRLAAALLELAAWHGTSAAGGITLRPYITRDDLAGLTGTTLYTVSRVCREWQRRGLMESGRGRVRLLDLPRLAAVAHGD